MNLQRADILRQASAHLRMRHLLQAQSMSMGLLRKNPKDVDAIEILAGVELADAQYDRAVERLRQCIALRPKEAKYHAMLGNVFSTAGRFPDAERCFEKALQCDGQFVLARAGLAHAFTRQGEHDRAARLLEPVVSGHHDDPETARIFALAQIGLGNHSLARQVLERHLSNGTPPAGLLFALGKAHERLGDADLAFAAYQAARLTDRLPFDLDRFSELIRDLRDVFSAGNIPRMATSSLAGRNLVFVTGRARSGTTLVSRIVGSHPAVFDAGELPMIAGLVRDINLEIGSTLSYPQCVLDMDRDDADRMARKYLDRLVAFTGPLDASMYVIDKNIGSWLSLGLIQLLFPGARVIHTTRNAVDHCFACFSEFLGPAHSWASDLRTLGLTHRMYESLMRHWRQVLSIPIMDVRYEELVEDQGGVSRRMIEFLGLNWDDRCLRFYERSETARSAAAVTLSHDQVRKPIYRTSLNRAEKFRAHLAPLLEALAEGAQTEHTT